MSAPTPLADVLRPLIAALADALVDRMRDKLATSGDDPVHLATPRERAAARAGDLVAYRDPTDRRRWLARRADLNAWRTRNPVRPTVASDDEPEDDYLALARGRR